MSTNKIKAANLEDALRVAIRATREDEQSPAKSWVPPAKSAFLEGLEENLRRFEAGEHLEIDYTQ